MNLGKLNPIDTTCIPLNLLTSSINCPPIIKGIIEKLSSIKDFIIQQECIKSLPTHMNLEENTESNHAALKLLAFIYLSCTPKNPIKKTVGRIILQYKRKDEQMIDIFSETIKIIVLYLVKENNDLIYNNFIVALGNGFDITYVVKALFLNKNDVFILIVNFLGSLIQQLGMKQKEGVTTLSDIGSYISNVCKFLLSLLQKCDGRDLNKENRFQLIVHCYSLINEEYVEYEIKSNCGLLMTLLFKVLPDDLCNLCMFKKYPYLEFLKYGKEGSFVLEKLGILVTEPKKVKSFKICIYLGIMILASDDVLKDTLLVNDQHILNVLFNEVIDSSNWSIENSTIIIGVSKALSIISSHLNCLPHDNILPLLKQGLKFIIMYIQDKAEIIRINTRNMFENFIKLALSYQKCDKPYLLETIFNWIRNMPQCVARYSCITALCAQAGCSLLLNRIPNLPHTLLFEMIHSGSMHNVCACYETLMKRHLKETNRNDWVQFWVNPLIMEIKVAPYVLSQFYLRLFLSAFKLDSIALQALTQTNVFKTDNEICTLLICIHYIRKVGTEFPLNSLYFIDIDENVSWRNLLDYKTLEALCTHQNDQVRILVLSVIADNQRSTEIFTPWELQFLLKYFQYNINAPKASTRQQIVAYGKKVILRIQESFPVLQKNMHSKDEEIETSVDDYNSFWTSLFCKVFLRGIHQGCNYSRRSACLELLHFIMSNNECHNFDFKYCWKTKDIDNLKDILLYDTYERNKDLATDMLCVFSSEQLQFHTPERVTLYIKECFLLASSIKPSETVSSGYLFKICTASPHVNEVITKMLSVYNYEMEHDQEFNDSTYLLITLFIAELKIRLNIGETNLQEAAKTKPLHGFMFCIRHLLKHENLKEKINKSCWRSLIQEIVDLCASITTLISTIICNKSPEGYLPDEVDSESSETDGTTKAQMVTVYGWRAAKEVSLLFGEIAINTEFLDAQHPEGLIDEQCLKRIGDCFLYLLINTKHRGAFEQASIGFSFLCSKLWRLRDTDASFLPKIWLHSIIDLLLGDGDGTSQACETRRSAGIPFLIQAVLTTEPNTNGNRLFHWCMNKMLNVAGDMTRPDEQRIHCLNILRALYRHNQLGELVLPYCARGVIIAIDGFSSTIWCIRNSATLLFSALVVRIFGVQRSKDLEVIDIKNKMLAHVFFTRHPELYPFLLQQLDKGTRHHYVSMFPVLLILSRLYCSTESGDSFQIEEYLPFIKQCLKDSAYKTRELAAKTLVNLTKPGDVPQSIILAFIQLSVPNISNNHCHGTLLHLQYLLQHSQINLPTLNLVKILNNTAWILLHCGRQTSHLTATLYLEILLFLIMRLDANFNNTLVYEKIANILQNQTPQNEVSTATKKYKIYIFHLQLCLMFNRLKSQDKKVAVMNLINSDLKVLSMHYLFYLTVSTRNDYSHYAVHEEYYTEYYELIEKFVKPLDKDCKSFLHAILFNGLSSKHCNLMNIEDSFIQYCSPEPINALNNSQILFEQLLNGFNSTEDQILYLSTVFLDNFLEKLQDQCIQVLDFNNMVNFMLGLSVPSAYVSSRFAVSELLVHNKHLFYRSNPLISGDINGLIWIITFLLLEDDDTMVRNSISRLCETSLTEIDGSTTTNPYSFIPTRRLHISEYAKDILLDRMIASSSSQCSINILLSLILRQTEVTGKNISEVFDEGALNTYAELYTLTRVALKKLWEIMLQMCYSSKSINLIKMTRLLHKTMLHENILLISDGIKLILCNILNNAASYIENNCNEEDLRTFYKETVSSCHHLNDLDVLEKIRFNMFTAKIFQRAIRLNVEERIEE